VLVENFKMAVAAILANKMRAFLTMLGIIIGIGSVIITTALGDSVRKMFSDIYAGIGVTQGMLHISGEDFRESDLFTIDDIEKYKKRADFVLFNDGNRERTEDAIRQFIQRF